LDAARWNVVGEWTTDGVLKSMKPAAESTSWK
jgi:hypothetical protein